MYAVCGATGHIVGALAEKLLKAGEKVRAIGRSADRLKPLVDKGAEAVVADLMDTKAVAAAFKGAKAAFVMIPPNMKTADFRRYQNEIGQSLADAIVQSGIKNVVNLSSVGAQNAEGVGVVNGLHDQEERLNKLDGVNVVHLRPSFFMENHFWQIDSIRNNGMFATPQNPEHPIPQIATRDIADFAFARMTLCDFQGKTVRELLGPQDISMHDAATAIGHGIGKDDLKVVQVPYETVHGAMTSMGISENVADGMIELYRAMDEGTFKPTETRSADNTTPTKIADFSTTFAAAYGS